MLNRRDFLRRAGGGVVASALGPGLLEAFQEAPRAPAHTLTVISGTPRERGRQYGNTFKDSIRAFLENEVYGAFTSEAPSRDNALRYAGLCLKEIRRFSAVVTEEMEGMAEGSGLRLEEIVLTTLHEELGHKGVLPGVEKCTALAAGPPDTSDGCAYVGQNWDWMESVTGLSNMLLWKRPEGPSVLAYAYPGLWAGAGLNSAGIGLTWTWGDGLGFEGPRAGIPSYALIAQMLYQDTLEAAVAEARRGPHAGWFCFLLADGEGKVATVDGTPRQLHAKIFRGHAARASYGDPEVRAADGSPAPVNDQCRRMADLLQGSKGKLDQKRLQGFFGDHESTICKHYATLDSMLYNCTKREAWLSRGPGCSGAWKRFGFDGV
jgi:isopenicillin-N N-acyltransferase-like protein